MEDTIIALLNNNLRVIIPDFGAFIIRQKQPRIIVFNEFLRYNDGILIDFIVKTEGIDRDIAEQRVLDFAEDGTKLLASGREMIIAGLGSLRKDSSGKINFVEVPEIIEIDKQSAPVPEIITEEEKKHIPPVAEQEVPQKSKPKPSPAKKTKTAKTAAGARAKIKVPGAEFSAVEPTVEPAVEQVLEPAIEPAPEPAIERAANEGSEIEPAIEPMAVEPEAIEPATEPAVEPIAFESANEPAAIETQAEPKTLETVVNIPPVRKPPPAEDQVSYAERPAPVQTNRILAWILLILFVNLGILGWFVFRKKTHEKPVTKAETTMISDSLSDQLADSVRAAAMDSHIVFNDENYKEANNGTDSQTPGSRYYIVAGCFRDEVNADSLVASLKLLGYKAEKFGKIGNLYAVCFASFDDKEKAVPELKKIREKVPSAWMTKF
jgi:hypothetical protein